MSYDIEDESTVTEAVNPDSLRGGEYLSLLVVRGPDAGRWFRVATDGGLVGRSPEVHIRIADPAVSREHAVIEVNQKGVYLIRDLGSRNGVFIEGKRVDLAPILDGVQIQLSTQTVLRARFSGPVETEIWDELQKAAQTDPLTGLANRRYLMHRLEQELSFARRHRMPLSLLLIDVDAFKPINDHYGHHGGDAVLKKIASTLRATTRVEDVVARYGGDEFVIISRGYPPTAATKLANRLCDVVRDTDIRFGAMNMRVTLSIGVAGCDADQLANEKHKVDRTELFICADTALYQAKQGGRDQAVQYEPLGPESANPDDWMRSTLTDGRKVNLEPKE